jgi:hypothetical protein
MPEEMLAGLARMEGEEQSSDLEAEIAAVKAKYRAKAPKPSSRGIYSLHANDWRGAVLEFAPEKSGKLRHGKLMKISNPGTSEAQALIGWTHVQDMTHAEIIDMEQVPWPLPGHKATVIQQPRMGVS